MAKLIAIGSIVVIFGILLYLVNLSFTKVLHRRSSIVMKFAHSATNIALVLIAAYAILSQFDMAREISSTILKSGTLLIAVLTFAAQQALGNIISGFIISASHPLDLGQKVKLLSGGSVIAEGIVKDMSVRHVVIEQYDGQSCIVPNSVVDQAVIVNVNYIDDVGNFLSVEVAYDTDLQLARSLIRSVLEEEPLCIKKDVAILTSQISANGLVLKFNLWTKCLDDSFIASSNVRENIVKRFIENGIEIPYQTNTILMEKDRSEPVKGQRPVNYDTRSRKEQS